MIVGSSLTIEIGDRTLVGDASFVVGEGEKVGLSCPANAALTDIVKRVECNELKPDPQNITELRLH